jgi:hypothetical protein
MLTPGNWQSGTGVSPVDTRKTRATRMHQNAGLRTLASTTERIIAALFC